MLPYTNTALDVTEGGTTYLPDAAKLHVNHTYVFAWMPTARSLFNAENKGNNTITQTAARTASTCFMRGLKEKISFNLLENEPFKWRRICFTIKDQQLYSLAGPGKVLYGAESTLGGYVRVLNSVTGTDLYEALQNVVFKGIINRDWNDPFTAPVDTARISLRYDKTRSLNPGSDGGTVRTFNLWHPMNKNLVYDDDETGDLISDNSFSTGGKAGMGDYFVLDFISGYAAEDSNDLSATFSPEATLYWHEK